jgi:N-hydroxyarylamine O-acetyltransferase
MDLAAYFVRIGYDGPRAVSRAVLADIVLRHALSIPFENIDAYLGRRISLEPDAVERKLVSARRGGWCFEQNLLLGNALRALGFDVTDLAGRVVWGRPADAVAPRTHRLLCVRLEGRDWLVDVGFGGQTLTGVLDLDSAEPQTTPHEPFRLRAVGGERMLESRVNGEWVWLYRFDMHPQLHVDFEAANYQLVHDLASPFTQGLRAARVSEDGRHALRGLELVFHGRDGSSQRSELAGVKAVLAALQDVFGIDVTGMPELPARIAAQIGSAARS